MRAAWFKMDLGHADWVPVLAKNGFAFHHADAHGNLAMNKWLAKDEACQVRFSIWELGNKEAREGHLTNTSRFHSMPITWWVSAAWSSTTTMSSWS
jgi:hypothetical protein